MLGSLIIGDTANSPPAVRSEFPNLTYLPPTLRRQLWELKPIHELSVTTGHLDSDSQEKNLIL